MEVQNDEYCDLSNNFPKIGTAMAITSLQSQVFDRGQIMDR